MKKKWTSYNKQSERANWFDDEKNGLITPIETAIRRTKRSATADDDVLGRCLVFQYENAIKEGKSTKEALGRVEAKAREAVEKGLWTKENLYTLWQAIEGGELARQALNAVTGGPSEDKMYPFICAVQVLVKENPVVLRLPFIQDALIYILHNQKYSADPVRMKDLWVDFLHKRPKGKILHSPGSLKRLINKVKKEGVKPVDAHAAIGEAMGKSESFLKKATASKGRGPGRAKKGK